MAKSDEQSNSEHGPSFEDALEELQQIVADLEEGSMGLEESMQRFETGIGLLRQCYQTLEQAEQKIQILTGLDAEGNPVTAPFDASATFTPTEGNAGKRSTKKKRAEPKQPPPCDAETDDPDGTLF